MLRLRQSFLLILLALAVFATAAYAQSGVIQGTLDDPQGRAIATAKVTAYDENKGLVVREAQVQSDGAFQLQPLLQGTYTVKVESAGFKSFERKGVVLDPNQVLNIGTIHLELGTTVETVTVDAQAPLVETTTSQRGFVITSRQVTEISLNGRDFQSLLRTLPGVVSNDTSDFRLAFNNTDAFNINGMRGSQNNFYLDGSINTDVGANDGQYTQLSMDAVGEFKEQAGVFNAEYGRNPGILLSATMKSGSKNFHGTAYEFLRNSGLDSRNPFDTTGKVPKLNFNQFGGNLGGPIYAGKLSPLKDPRLFFFFNYEGTRASKPNGGITVNTVAPELLTGDFTKNLRFNTNGTPSLIAGTTFNTGTIFQPGSIVRNQAGNIIGGIPFPDNKIPVSMFAKNTPAFLKVINRLDRSRGFAVPGSTDTSQIQVPISDTYRFRKDQKALRVDYAMSSKTNFFFHWVDDAQREGNGLGIFTSSSYPVVPQYRKKPGSSWAWNLVNTISPTMTNELIFTYNHLTQVVDIDNPDPATYDRTQLGFTFQELYPKVNRNNRFPQFSCGTGCSFSDFASTWLSEGKTFAWTDNLTKIHGAHTFKTGVLINRNNNGQQPSWTDAININFGPSAQNPNDTNNQTANLLLGNYTSVSQTADVYYGTFRFFQFEAFGQDSWKVNRNLTLEMGLRWAYIGPTNTYGKFLQNYFDPTRYDPKQAVQIYTAGGNLNGTIIPGSGNPFNGMVEEGKGIPLGFMKHRYNNWSPRLGIAWDPFGDGKTSIRAGGGIFYERVRQNDTNFDGLGNPPLQYTPTIFGGGNVDNISPALVASGSRSTVNVVAIAPEGKLPTIYSWSLDIQRQIGRTMSLDVAYVGNASAHLLYVRDLGQLPLGTTTNTPILVNANNVTQAIRPFLGYNSVNYHEPSANANYNALQTRLSRRFAKSLQLNASYVWSKAFDSADADGTAIGYYLDRHREYGVAGFDRTHVFNFDYTYNLPDFGTKAGNNGFTKAILNGWELSGKSRFSTGPPATITANGASGTLGGGVRADYLGGQLIPDSQDRYNYFNPFVFGRPVNGSLGNLGRNTIRLPGINNWDASMFKNTKLGERVTAQLRFEFFNVFNHTQWAGVNTGISGANPGDPVSTATRGTSGQVTSTRDPRNIQLSLKLLF